MIEPDSDSFIRRTLNEFRVGRNKSMLYPNLILSPAQIQGLLKEAREEERAQLRLAVESAAEHLRPDDDLSDLVEWVFG